MHFSVNTASHPHQTLKIAFGQFPQWSSNPCLHKPLTCKEPAHAIIRLRADLLGNWANPKNAKETLQLRVQVWWTPMTTPHMGNAQSRAGDGMPRGQLNGSRAACAKTRKRYLAPPPPEGEAGQEARHPPSFPTSLPPNSPPLT